MNEESLFHEALARSTPQERSAFLTGACAGQPDLRAAVEALLAAHEQDGGFLPSFVAAKSGPTSESAADPEAPVPGDGPLLAQDSENRIGETDRESSSAGVETIDSADSKFSVEARAPQKAAKDIPDRIGRYEIRGLLGRGGMGAVYLAHDPELDRLVALKVPKLVGKDAEERFIREGRAAAAVTHPNLCPVYDASRADGVLYLAMSYLPGPTLTKVLQTQDALSPTQAAAIALGIARGMAEAHRHGIVHRDLKPGNILLNGRSEPVVTDFGLALRASVIIPAAQSAQTMDHESRLTHSGVLLGTPAYMSPEQARGDVERIGPSSDVYALGAILFELLTGKPPFPVVPLVDMVRLIENEPAPAASAVRRGVPQGLGEICRRAMAKNPAERFPSMDAFAEALTPFAAKSSGRRWRRIAVAAALALVLAVAGTVIYVQTDNGTIEIRLNEPAANVQVVVDGNEIQLTDQGRVTKLRSGPHGLEIKGPDFETIARTFKVIRGKNPVLEVELTPKTKAPGAKTAGSLAQTAQRSRLASLLARGEQLYVQVQHGEAEGVVNEALTLDAESPTALGLRALLRISHGEMAKARADAETALKLNPETFRALLAMSILNSDKGNTDERIAFEIAAIRLRPDNPWAWSNRAKSFLDKKEYRQAIADATQATKLGGKHAGPLLTRGAAYAHLGNYDKALADYDAAVERAPGDPSALDQRARVHVKMGNRSKAESDWKKAKALNPAFKPDDHVALPDPPKIPLRKKLSADKTAELGELLAAIERNLVLGGPQDVLKIADEALLIDPTSPAAHSARARALTELDRHREALAEAEKTLPLAPNDAWLYVSRGVARGAMTDPVAAIPDLTIAITLAPANAYAWGNRGYAFALRGQYYQAVADLDKAIALKSVSQFHMNRGSSYVFLGEYAKALVDYETTAKLDPDNAQWRMICSVLRSRLGDTDGARKDREAAIKIDAKLKDAPPMRLPSPLPPSRLDPVLPEESGKS